MAKNVFGEPLLTCSTNPLTGFFRDGCCKTGPEDLGSHTVCAQLSEEFLTFSKSRGNDLTTARPEFNFPGLKPGDFWCLCVNRWYEAYKGGKAPGVKLEATHENALNVVALKTLLKFAIKSRP